MEDKKEHLSGPGSILEFVRGKSLGLFKKDNLILMILAGILLFIIALPTKETEKESPSITESINQSGNLSAENVPVVDFTGMALASGDDVFSKEGGQQTESLQMEGLQMADLQNTYGQTLERQLEEVLSSVEGVGKVKTMITFACSQEYILEKESLVNRSNTVEKDSQGGNRTVTQYQAEDTTVYSNNSEESIPYVTKTLSPRVEGVLVVAQGAGNGTVNRNITEVVQALFGLEIHKVKVVPMKAD